MMTKTELKKSLKVVYVAGHRAPTLFIPRDVLERYNSAALGRERIVLVGGESIDPGPVVEKSEPQTSELTQAIIEEVMAEQGVERGVVYLEAYDVPQVLK